MRTSILCILLVGLSLSLPGLYRPFSTRGEPREAIVAQDMIRSGNYILPSGYGDDVPSKPPLLHWCMVGASMVTGELGEFESRVPSAIASLIFVISFFLFLAPRIGESRALIASMVLLTSFEWARAASASRVDLLLSSALAGGLLGLYRWYEQSWRGVPVLAFFCLVLATLAKGPVAIVVPLGILGAWILLTRSLSAQVVLKLLLFSIGVALGALIWYGAAYVSAGEKFIEMIYDENVRRFAGTMEGAPHAHGLWYYPAMLIVGLLPWSVPLIVGARRPVVVLLKEWIPQKHSFDTFSVLVGLSFLTFFSLPESKRSVYLLPAYPFYAVFLSRFIVQAESRVERALSVVAWIIILLGVTAVSLVLLPADSLLQLLKVKPQVLSLYTSIRELFLAASFGTKLLLAFPLVFAIAWYRIRSRLSSSWARVVVATAVVVSVLNWTVVSWAAHALTGRWFANSLQSSLLKEDRLYSFGDEFYDLSFYLDRRIFRITDSVEDGALVVVAEDTLQGLQSVEPGITLREISRSTYSITKPGQHVLLVRVSKGESR